jgi:hypothetical protein
VESASGPPLPRYGSVTPATAEDKRSSRERPPRLEQKWDGPAKVEARSGGLRRLGWSPDAEVKGRG